MAVGDLSRDQTQFRDLVVQSTAMRASVMAAWIGCESGWSVTKPTHNYLNIGPGRSYPSVDAAAKDAAHEIKAKGIDAAGSVAAQADAIGASDWGTDGTCVKNAAKQLGVYDEPLGGGNDNPLGFLNPLDPLAPVKSIPAALNALPNAVTSGLGKLIAPLGKALLTVFLASIFTGAGLALIGLGIVRLTGNNADGALATAGNAANLAAVAAAV